MDSAISGVQGDPPWQKDRLFRVADRMVGGLWAIKSYYGLTGVKGLANLIRGKLAGTPILTQARTAKISFPFFIRIPSSDYHAFNQIFLQEEYNFRVSRAPRTIVDAGANIGLASIYFSNKFPDSQIIAIEPEESNFAVLKKNVELYPNVLPVHAALWSEDIPLNVVDTGRGKLGFSAQPCWDDDGSSSNILHNVRGVSINSLIEEHGIDRIDILKLDIEGAEREVFEHSSSWIEKVDGLIIELHERMRPGCNRSFYNATKGFGDEWLLGENIYLARAGACMTRDVPTGTPEAQKTHGKYLRS